MSTICPTVLADDAHAYRDQIERIQDFAERIQIDLKDGDFAPGNCVTLDQIWLPDGILADLHIMYRNPQQYLEKIVGLKPNMVIVHAESNCDIPKFASDLRAVGIMTGVAILQDTKVADVAYVFPHVQHLLIFSGNLGQFGGKADLSLVEKISEAKSVHKYLEIGWDGGINAENCTELATAGVDVLNVGGAIQNAEAPQEAYGILVSKLDAIKND